MAAGESADLARKPAAGFVAIMSAKSCSAWAEISITGYGVGNPAWCSRSASSKPLCPPRSMSTSVTSGRSP